MNFLEIAQTRQSCRAYDEHRPVEQERLDAVLEAADWPPPPATPSPTISPSAVGKQQRQRRKPVVGWE